MTDLTPSAAELAAITLNGRRLTPEQSSWLVGSLQHERAYCSTPGELLELLSHPTPPPAPEVAQSAAAILGSAVEVANIREAAVLVQHIDEGYHYRRLSESAAVLESHAECIIAARNERDAATQRAEAAERGRDEAREALKTAQYGYRTMRGMLAKERTSATPAAPIEARPNGDFGDFDRDGIHAWRCPEDGYFSISILRGRDFSPPEAHALGEWLTRMTPNVGVPPAAPSELAKELREWARLCRDRYDLAPAVGQAFERAASALCAPGSEAPEIEPRTSYSIKLSAEGDTEIFEDLTVTEAAFLSDIAENLELARQSFAPRMFVTSHPASPAAGKEAM